MTDLSDCEFTLPSYENCIVTTHNSDEDSSSDEACKSESSTIPFSWSSESEDAISLSINPLEVAESTLNAEETFTFILEILNKVEKFLYLYKSGARINWLKTHILLAKLLMLKHHHHFQISEVKIVDGKFYTTSKSSNSESNDKTSAPGDGRVETDTGDAGTCDEAVPSARLSPIKTKRTRKFGTSGSPKVNAVISEPTKRTRNQRRKSVPIGLGVKSGKPAIQNDEVGPGKNQAVISPEVSPRRKKQPVRNMGNLKRKSAPFRFTQPADPSINENPTNVGKIEKKTNRTQANVRFSGIDHLREMGPNPKSSSKVPNAPPERTSERLQKKSKEKNVVFCDRLSAVALRLGASYPALKVNSPKKPSGNLIKLNTGSKTKKTKNGIPKKAKAKVGSPKTTNGNSGAKEKSPNSTPQKKVPQNLDSVIKSPRLKSKIKSPILISPPAKGAPLGLPKIKSPISSSPEIKTHRKKRSILTSPSHESPNFKPEMKNSSPKTTNLRSASKSPFVKIKMKSPVPTKQKMTRLEKMIQSLSCPSKKTSRVNSQQQSPKTRRNLFSENKETALPPNTRKRKADSMGGNTGKRIKTTPSVNLTRLDHGNSKTPQDEAGTSQQPSRMGKRSLYSPDQWLSTFCLSSAN